MFSLLHKKGFTLIELLLVIGIIAILASIVIVAVNPSLQLKSARNAQRRSDVHTIINAYYQYLTDNGDFQPGSVLNGEEEDCNLPQESLGDDPRAICLISVANGGEEGECGGEGCVYSGHLSGTYLAAIPSDPLDDESEGNLLQVDYEILELSNGRIRVVAPNAENGETIEVER